jgi:hypothetical protein
VLNSSQKYEVKFSLPNRLLCYVDYRQDPDDLVVLRSEGFNFKHIRRKQWSDEEQRMLLVGLHDIRSGKLVLETPNIGYFLSHHVMDGCRSPKECSRALKNLCLKHELYEISAWCAKLKEQQ